MASERRETPLSDLTDPEAPITYGVVKPGPEDPDGVLFIRGGDIAGGRVLTEQLRTITDEVSRKYQRTLLRGGEIIVSLVGNPGQVAIVPDTLNGANIARQVGLVRLRKEVDARFVKYFLGSRTGQQALGAQSRGSVQQVINLRDLKTIRVPTPPLPEQRAIAHILGTLDDKIELNRRMSETLAAMARALFKSWFVDFDPVRAKAEGRKTRLHPEIDALFPHGFEDSEIGAVPKGWKIVRLAEMLTIDRGVSYKGEGLVAAGRPMINLGCFAGEGRFREDKVKGYDGEFRPRHLVRPGELVVANTDMTQQRVILGSPIIIPEYVGECLFSHHVYGLRFTDANASARLLVYYNLLEPSFREKAEGYATGTTVLFLPQDAILNSAIAMPPHQLLEAFNRQAEALRGRTETATIESTTLVKTRDALLPKLVSGEIRVPVSAEVPA